MLYLAYKPILLSMLNVVMLCINKKYGKFYSNVFSYNWLLDAMKLFTTVIIQYLNKLECIVTGSLPPKSNIRLQSWSLLEWSHLRYQ
jgi:hypothetical protein